MESRDEATEAARAEAFLAAIRAYDETEARRRLEAEPGLATASVYAACAAGATDEVARRLAADAGAATAVHEGSGWAPLLYACASLLHGGDPAREQGLLR